MCGRLLVCFEEKTRRRCTLPPIVLNTNVVENDTQHMTSLEIAQLTGKQHKDVLKAIRNMEPAWENTTGRKFALCERSYMMANGVEKLQPYFSLTKTECLYIATKFSPEHLAVISSSGGRRGPSWRGRLYRAGCWGWRTRHSSSAWRCR